MMISFTSTRLALAGSRKDANNNKNKTGHEYGENESKNVVQSRKTFDKVLIKDLEVVATLGIGGFAR